MRRFVDKVQATRQGNTIRLRMLRDMAAAAVAFDAEAPHLDRLLAAAASDVMRPPVVEAAIREDQQLRQAVVDLTNAQTGDVRLGPVAGRDVITLNVYLGAVSE